MQVTIDGKKLAAFAKAFTPQKPGVRYYLIGVNFEFLPCGRINMVATDGGILGAEKLETPCDNPPSIDTQFIVPAAALKALKGIVTLTFTPSDDTAKPGTVTIASGATSTTCALVAGKFPDYRRVMRPANTGPGFAQWYDPELLSRAADYFKANKAKSPGVMYYNHPEADWGSLLFGHSSVPFFTGIVRPVRVVEKGLDTFPGMQTF